MSRESQLKHARKEIFRSGVIGGTADRLGELVESLDADALTAYMDDPACDLTPQNKVLVRLSIAMRAARHGKKVTVIIEEP